MDRRKYEDRVEKKMKKKLLGLFLAVLVLMISPFITNASGEEAKSEATPEVKPEIKPEANPATSPEEIKKMVEEIKNFLGLSIYLQGGYTFNFRNPDSGTNEQRIFDQKANSFLIDLAQIQFLKDAPVGGLGYKLKVSLGETARFIHSAGLGGSNDVVDLTEAYIDYRAPLGSGLGFRFGKFATYHGAEVIEARDDFNYSRSFLFNYAIPFTHTGFMAGYTFSKALTANVYVVNGWDVTSDNNKGKTFGTGFVVTPIEPFSMNFGFMYGPEQSHQSSGWYGFAGYVKYDFTNWFSTSVRAEYFDDTDGVRTGIAQKLKEMTITPEFKIVKNLLLRPEYRHDWSNKDGFDSHHNTFNRKSQDTIAIGLMYTW
jgi:hypothetical protein